jgi:hypothetical protein
MRLVLHSMQGDQPGVISGKAQARRMAVRILNQS